MTAPEKPALKFSLSELAGAFGDFGTIIPLILAVALVTTMNVGYMLLFFGIWFLISGWYYGLPIPIEPMKAIAVVVIAKKLVIPAPMAVRFSHAGSFIRVNREGIPDKCWG